MNHSSKIYIAGHTGLVGSSLLKTLKKQGYTNLLTQTHKELDLTDQQKTQECFRTYQPNYVFLAAAKVGGIHANTTYPVDFILDNLLIQSNIIQSAFENQVKKLMFIGSSCMYPKLCVQPMHVDSILTGPLEKTNESYAIAKLAGMTLCQSFNQQYQTDYITVIPANLYGPNDNYHPENSHVIPALIRRFHEAKLNNKKHVILWGTGAAKREFLYVDDMVDAAIFLMKKLQR
jgi:GDP-L-fucose synthase